MLVPIISLCCSKPSNKMTPWIFDICLKCKLRLPLYTTTDTPFACAANKSTHLVTTSSNVPGYLKLAYTIQFVTASDPSSPWPSPPLATSSPPPLLKSNPCSTYNWTQTLALSKFLSTQILPSPPMSLTHTLTQQLALTSPSVVHLHD
jgi:hypothetical protein